MIDPYVPIAAGVRGAQLIEHVDSMGYKRGWAYVATITASEAVGEIATDTREVILADATAGAIVLDLPPVATNAGRRLTVKKIDASGNSVTIDGDGAETIDGAATKATSTQWAGWKIVCDGTAWFIE